jgi:hypothetical protein
VFDNYKLQEDPNRPGRLVLQRGEKVTITRKEGTDPWVLADLPAGQELVEDKLRALTDALGDLKIVGIRPRPAGLKNIDAPDLKMTQMVMASLQSKGFFLTTQGLFSDQGDVLVSTDDGVVYTLRYGGPVFAEGEDLTRGSADDEEKKNDPAKKDASKKASGTQENRYLMVTVSFDPKMVPKPESMEPRPSTPPVGPVAIPDKPFAPDPSDPKYLADQKEAKEKADREKADYDKKLADGQKKVDEFVDRFGGWYYVTPGDSFRSIDLDRAAITQPKKPPGDPGAAMPDFHGGGGMPPGLPPGFPPRRRP